MAEEKDSNNIFGSYNNKYVRGGAAALLAAYVAKEDPYLLEGFAESIEEKQKADRETRNAIIKAATEAKLKFKAEDKKRRNVRLKEVEPAIKQAKENGINPVVAAKALEAGMLDTLIKVKIAYPNKNVNDLYTISEDYKDKVSGITHSQIIESLVGKSEKYGELVNTIQAPKITNPLRKFVQGTDRDTDITSDIETRFAAMDVEKDDSDIVDVDLSKIQQTEKGKEIIAKFLRKDPTTKVQLTQAVKNFTSNFMNVGLRYDSKMGDYVFASDDIENVKYANLIAKHFVDEAEQLRRDPDSVAFNDREMALGIIKDKYLIPTEEGPRKLNFSKINEQYENPLIPEGWTPPTPTKSEIEKSKEKKKEEKKKENLTSEEAIVQRWELQKQRIRENKNFKGMPKLIDLEIRKQKKLFVKQMNDLKGDINLLTND